MAQGALHPLAMLLHARPEQDQADEDTSQARFCMCPCKVVT